MPHRKQNRSWRLLRIYFRRFRIGMWLVLIVVLGSLLYLNQIGLPDFAKKPLVEKLRARGIDLQFTRLRLRFDRGIVAENVLIGGKDENSPRLMVKEVQVRPDFRKLATLHLQINSLMLREGRIVCPLATPNQPTRELAVEQIQTELQFLPGDLWKLDNLQAQLAGANLQLSGVVTNASAVRNWKFSRGSGEPGAGKKFTLQDRLRALADTLEQIHFPSAPELKLEVFGDARDAYSFGARLLIKAPGAETPWGTVERGVVSARIVPPSEQGRMPQAEIILRAASGQTRWANANNLELTFHAIPDAETNFNAEVNLTAEQFESKWGSASNVQFRAEWLHSPTNAIPLSGRGELRVAEAQTKWGRGTDVQLTGWLSTPTNLAVMPDASWDRWTNVAPYALNLDARVGLLQSTNLVATNLLCAAQWRAPHLRVSKLAARLYDGALDANANLDVTTREFTFADESNFDVKGIAGLLTPMARHWLGQYSWEKPPQLEAQGALTLPAWTNRHPDWRAEVKPTIRLRGHITAGRGAFRGVDFDSANLHFFYTNLFWRLPDIVAIRPEGKLEMLHEANDATQDYYFRFHSTVDARAIRPLLGEAQQRGFALVGFSAPPIVDAEVWGRWRNQERIGVKASVSLTNFTFRGEKASGLQSLVTFTNAVLTFIEPRVQHGTQYMNAASVTLDLNVEKVFITKGVGAFDPGALTRAIGPIAARAMEPYHFLTPPVARVEGAIGIRHIWGTDLHFDVDGGGFSWWKFNVSRISGKIDWVNDKLTLRGIKADFYGGQGEGDAEFDFSKNDTTDCHFDVVVTNSNLHWLMSDLSSETNRLEGTLAARLTVTQGDAGNPDTWRGVGRARLENGLIWELPVFGVLSPMLEGVAPGLGNSRATDATANFVLTNGIVHSDDLEIRATGTRLQYRGDVGLDGHVDARVEAELLRNTWVIGKMLSLALWPISKVFEYKITGTLAKPKMEPLYFVPRLILMPLHPFETMKDLLPKQTEPANTNAPPANLP